MTTQPETEEDDLNEIYQKVLKRYKELEDKYEAQIKKMNELEEVQKQNDQEKKSLDSETVGYCISCHSPITRTESHGVVCPHCGNGRTYTSNP